MTLALLASIAGSATLVAADKGTPAQKPLAAPVDKSQAPAPVVEEKMDEASSKSNEMDSKESKENNMSAESAERKRK